MQRIWRHTSKITSAAIATLATAATVGAMTTTAASAAAPAGRQAPAANTFKVSQVLSGSSLSHKFVPVGSTMSMTEPLAGPDDITMMGGHLFVAFQNGVGSQGEPSASGNRNGTVVEFTTRGKVLHQWDIRGKCDGMTADAAHHRVIATVNEDAHSSLFVIRPGERPGLQIAHFRYNRPLPHKGGTDAISIFRGMVLISASAPGTTGASAPQPSYPAVYRVTFNNITRIATIRPLFFDEAVATVANLRHFGRRVHLALTDPDSNEVVPAVSHRFGGAFMLDSQGDKEQIYVVRPATARQHLFVLSLSQSIDDTAWATSRNGRLFATNAADNAVDVVTGRFPVGTPFVAVTPCDAANAPGTCPAPPAFPANFLGIENPFTGHIVAASVTGADLQPKGMLFVR